MYTFSQGNQYHRYLWCSWRSVIQ